MSICEKCGESVSIGDWPWCPHGVGNNLEHPMAPYIDEMIDRDGPREFRTIGEKVRYMDRNAIIPRDLSEKRPGRKLYFT